MYGYCGSPKTASRSRWARVSTTYKKRTAIRRASFPATRLITCSCILAGNGSISPVRYLTDEKMDDTHTCRYSIQIRKKDPRS